MGGSSSSTEAAYRARVKALEMRQKEMEAARDREAKLKEHLQETRHQAEKNQIQMKANMEKALLENQIKMREEMAKAHKSDAEIQKKMDAMQRQSDKQMAVAKEQHAEDIRRMKAAEESHQKERDALLLRHQELEKSMKEREQRHEAALAEFKEKNKEDIKKHEEELVKLKDEMAKAKYEFNDKDPDKLLQIDEDNFAKFLAGAAKYTEGVPKREKTSVAVLGPSGVGKSTFINSWAEKLVAQTGLEETTDAIEIALSTPELDFFDVPGSHDERADFFHIDNLHQMKSLHLVIVIYVDRVGHALKALKLLKALQVPMIMVRNKMPPLTAANEADLKEAFEMTQHKIEHKMGKGFNVPLFFLEAVPGIKPGEKAKGFDKVQKCVREILQLDVAAGPPTKKAKS